MPILSDPHLLSCSFVDLTIMWAEGGTLWNGNIKVLEDMGEQHSIGKSVTGLLNTLKHMGENKLGNVDRLMVKDFCKNKEVDGVKVSETANPRKYTLTQSSKEETIVSIKQDRIIFSVFGGGAWEAKTVLTHTTLLRNRPCLISLKEIKGPSALIPRT